MSSEVPNFGELLAPYIGAVQAEHVPNFLALLERGAASRYRGWAEMWPENCDGLLACAGREDEIADIVQGLFPIPAAAQTVLEELLPPALKVYYQVFEGMPVQEQLAIQADAELQGAAAWRAMLGDETPAEVTAGLERCSHLEELSSAYVKGILS